ncbi:WXG100 family type VII secretion target [Actinomadura sp. LD22]|uniref:ESAT-6-like protein n=1 Tax=Actinomadura physcomitrii TaxID=2650748 RepID=A0A6I4MPI7_9ACTN|nr:WXG100 family type VII secretion target [Actinomadura physcomitrii]MWA04719.1 WXG100 family type VII secretion target [Actinomadura physcomitrii]
MSNRSSVNRQHMQQAAGNVQDAHGQIGQIKNQLNTHHAELQSAWKGESSAAFTQVYNLFETEFAKVLKDLDLIHEKLVHTRAKYQTAEQNKTARVNTLKGLVNG